MPRIYPYLHQDHSIAITTESLHLIRQFLDAKENRDQASRLLARAFPDGNSDTTLMDQFQKRLESIRNELAPALHHDIETLMATVFTTEKA